MKRKKIIFTVTTDLTYDQRMERICTALAEAGYEVVIVGRKKQGSSELKKTNYLQYRLQCWFEKGKLFYLEYNFRLFFWLLFRSTDIISAVDLDTILPAFWVARLKNKKFVYDAHEYFTEVIEVVNRPAVKKIWLAIERYVLFRIQYAYTVSEGLKNEFEKKYPVRFEVIRNVPFLQKYRESRPEEKYLIYIGAVNEGRGLEELIDVMDEIPYPLYICGDGDLLEKIRHEVQIKRLEDKVKLFGYVFPEQLRELTRNAYLGYLILNPVSLSYYYSLANKFFDYIHAGIPQVVSDFPEYRTINQVHEVALLSNDNRKEIKENILRLINDQELYKRLKQNCVKAREEFNWQKESAKLKEFYRKVSEEA